MSERKKESRDEILARVAPSLTDRETFAYDYFRAGPQQQLSPELNAKLFALFLNGKSCEDIRALNPHCPLGQIVAARLEGQWDDRKSEHLDALLTGAALRVQQTTLSTAEFVCDLLAVASKEHGQKLCRYLQTGDRNELGDFKIDTLTGLKTTIEILQKLTGEDKKQNIKVSGQVVHSSSPTEVLTIKAIPTAEEAAQALKLLLGKVN